MYAGYDPGPATDQWSCDCGQHARKSKACISVRVFSRPKKRSGHQPLVVYLCVSECVCVSESVCPRTCHHIDRRMMNG